MQKSEFIAKIKKLAKQAYAEKSSPLKDPKDIAKELSPFPVINQFPPLQKIMDDLFDFQFEPFVKDIEWVAPRPTTFRIKLANEADFYLIFQGEDNDKALFVAQVAGKKYFLESLPEQQQASEAIARLLRFNYGKVEQNEVSSDLGGDLGGDPGGGLDTTTPETPTPEPEPAVPQSVEDL